VPNVLGWVWVAPRLCLRCVCGCWCVDDVVDACVCVDTPCRHNATVYQNAPAAALILLQERMDMN